MFMHADPDKCANVQCTSDNPCKTAGACNPATGACEGGGENIDGDCPLALPGTTNSGSCVNGECKGEL
jgi:hypothetical protein